MRKGDGKSSIGKGNEKIQPTPMSTASTRLQRLSTASAVQLGDKSRWKNSSPHTQQSSSPALENLLLMTKGHAKCSDQRCDQENRLRNNGGKSLAVDHAEKNEDHSKQPNQIKSQDGCVMLSGRKVGPKIHLFEEKFGFKKVNDRIVRVCDLDQASTKMLSLTTEVKQLLIRSASGDITGTEDDPKPPPPPDPLRIISDHSLDLSDEDYASDAPSDADPTACSQASRCFLAQLSSSSGSDDGSDSELQQLRWSEPPKESSGDATPRCARSADILARIFPQVRSTGKNKTDNEIWEKGLKSQHYMNGEDLHLYIQHSYYHSAFESSIPIGQKVILC